MLDLSEAAVIIRRNMKENLKKLWTSANTVVRGWFDHEADDPGLLPLTPRYDPEKHGIYFAAIQTALKGRRNPIRNIALTGSYGVGKSSILSEVARKHKRRVIAVSLSTLGFADDPKAGAAADVASGSKTNRIQKEIVKQLLYSQDPVKMPGSRYDRNTRFRFWRELGLAGLFSIPIAQIFFLAGWTSRIGKILPLPASLSLLSNVVILVAAVLLVLGVRLVFHNKIQIDKIGAGAASLSFVPKTTTYFDEYLDEIVYFFEVIKRDIVIFEDIDRFDEPHIFETLRSLNTLLNGAKQLRGRRIRFIYAIKDSIFDELGARAAKEELESEPALADDDAAEAEVARANRTKFFDLVIPVVPFITHRSARDLLDQTMKGVQQNISIDLIDTAARHVPDMRLMKNVRNEFLIFKNRVIDTGTLDLKQDGVFAMVLYKSTHLSDFELIKSGKSILDDLYRDSRILINENIAALNASISADRRALAGARATAQQSNRLGDALSNYIDVVIKHLPSARNPSRLFEGVELDDTMIRSQSFWEKLASTDGTVQVNYYHPSYGNQSLNFARKDIATALKEPIETAAWSQARREQLNARIAASVKDRAFVSRATMQTLMSQPEFTIEKSGEELSFEALARKKLKSELAVQLVAGGYIDQNFTLYTSTFYTTRVTANAMNFILKNVEPNVIDMHFALEHKDVEAILRERGTDVLKQDAAYNVDVLRYLLSSDPTGLAIVLGRLLGSGDKEVALIRAYLAKVSGGPELISALAPGWTDIFAFSITDDEVDDESRAALVNSALLASSAETSYSTNDDVRDFLTREYMGLSVFTSDQTSPKIAANVATLLRDSGAKLPALAGLAPNVFAAVADVGAFEVTRENLNLALGGNPESISLDTLRAADKNVFTRVLESLPTYLSLLEEDELAIVEQQAFIPILEAVLEKSMPELSAVVGKSDDKSVAADLSEVSSGTWPALVEHGRIVSNVSNVRAYVSEFNINQPLATLLEKLGRIEPSTEATEEEKLELALQILGAQSVLPSPKVRAELVASLALKKYIAASSIPVESGELVGRLIEENIVQDDDDTFAVIKTDDIDGRAFAISKSADFVSFMSPTEISPQDVGSLVAHEIVPDPVKEEIVDRFAEFTAGTSKAGLEIIAQWAMTNGKSLPLAEVARLASAGARRPLVVESLKAHLPTVTMAELAPILVSLGGEYKKLSARNGTHPRIAATPADRALVERLKALDLVSTYDERDGQLRINVRRS